MTPNLLHRTPRQRPRARRDLRDRRACRLAAAALAAALAFPAATALAQAAAERAAPPASAEAQAESKALQAIFDKAWEWSGREFPEFATFRGDHRFGDRLADISPEAEARRQREMAALVAEARAIRPDRLGASERISLSMFLESQQRFIDQAAFPAARGMSLRALGGPHTGFAELMAVAPVNTPERVRQLLARMSTAYPVRMEQEIAQLRRSAAAGWVPARDVLERVRAQIDTQLALAPEATPYFAPFTRLPASMPEAERETFRTAGREAIATHVLPGLRRLRALVADELMPRAPADGSLRHYPGGPAWYTLMVRQSTTTTLTPDQIHAIGQRELTRLRGEMEAVMREVKWAGDFASFAEHLNTDPRYRATSPEAMLATYRDIAKRIDAELPKLFAELPRAPFGIRPIPPHMGANRADYYNGPSLDGSRAGFFNANVSPRRTTWSMEAILAHEAAPGHHTQIARASELRGLPNFRRTGFGYTAFSEGWALYAETLGFDLGLYTDPLSRYGHLQWQAFRAARLVADTGIHALGWTRRQTIDFMVERTGVEREFVEGEIDRYTSSPGQALSYMIGKLKIVELRDRARARLGNRFDIRRFHNAVIDNGALPLSTLETIIDEWIAAEAAR